MKETVTTIETNNLGNAIAKINNQIIFIEKALPQETLKIEIKETKKNYKIATIKEIITKNKERIKPICKHYNQCGGCSFLHTTNQKELEIKQKYIEKLFKNYKINKIIPTNEYNYRNKVTLHIKDNKIGFYKKNTNNLIEIETCHLLKKEINETIKELKQINLNNINEIIIRTNTKKEIMIKITGIIENQDILKILKIKNLQSLYQNDKLIYKNPYLEETINNLKYTIYPNAFFQVNKEGMIKIYDLNRKYAQKGQKLLDLYCGTATIGIYLHDLYQEILGIEINKDSIKNAKLNKKINNINNINFICTDAKNIYDKYETVLVDPPRNGLSKQVTKKLLEIKPEKIIYTSCNPNTLKRDIKLLETHYKLLEITPVNMFPKTSHVECVSVLHRKSLEK